MKIATPEELIDDARNGRMFVLIDSEDRENEGDVIIPAQMATPDAINFMVKHARGLVCLAMSQERVKQLHLPLMSQRNETRHQTAFTISIEAREGVTTGISAADRARTIQVAIDPTKGADDIVTPGHIFPLVARDGGVLSRAGHTEAAVDIARLAGLTPAGVICEVMNDDGTMARLPDLIEFSQKHNLKIGTIADLIAFRRRKDTLVECVSEHRFVSDYGGEWTAKAYVNRTEGTEHLALTKGDLKPGEPTLVRMHALSFFDDALGRASSGGPKLHSAMSEIGRAGRGVVVIIRHTHSGDFTDLLNEEAPAGDSNIRDYGVGAQILLDLGVENLILLTNSRGMKYAGLEGYGLKIVEQRPIPVA